VKSSRRETSAPGVRKLGTLVTMVVVQCLPGTRSPRSLRLRSSTPGWRRFWYWKVGTTVVSAPDSPLPSGVGTEAEMSARVLWSDPVSHKLCGSESTHSPNTEFVVDCVPAYMGIGTASVSELPNWPSPSKSGRPSGGSSSTLCAKRHVLPCLQRPLVAKRHSFVL